MTIITTVVSVAPPPLTVLVVPPAAVVVVPVGYGLQGIPGPPVDLVADPLAYYILAKA